MITTCGLILFPFSEDYYTVYNGVIILAANPYFNFARQLGLSSVATNNYSPQGKLRIFVSRSAPFIHSLTGCFLGSFASVEAFEVSRWFQMRADAMHSIADIYAGLEFVAVNCFSHPRSYVGLFGIQDVCVGVLFRMRKSARAVAVKVAGEW